MKFFLYKIKMLFYQGDWYLWPHCCMNNLYISHRILYAPKYSFWAICSMFISLFRVTSWFDTVYNIVTRLVNFRKKNSCMNMNYNYPTTIFRSVFCLLDKKAFLFIQEKVHGSKSFWKIYPLNTLLFTYYVILVIFNPSQTIYTKLSSYGKHECILTYNQKKYLKE